MNITFVDISLLVDGFLNPRQGLFNLPCPCTLTGSVPLIVRWSEDHTSIPFLTTQLQPNIWIGRDDWPHNISNDNRTTLGKISAILGSQELLLPDFLLSLAKTEYPMLEKLHPKEIIILVNIKTAHYTHMGSPARAVGEFFCLFRRYWISQLQISEDLTDIKIFIYNNPEIGKRFLVLKVFTLGKPLSHLLGHLNKRQKMRLLEQFWMLILSIADLKLIYCLGNSLVGFDVGISTKTTTIGSFSSSIELSPGEPILIPNNPGLLLPVDSGKDILIKLLVKMETDTGISLPSANQDLVVKLLHISDLFVFAKELQLSGFCLTIKKMLIHPRLEELKNNLLTEFKIFDTIFTKTPQPPVDPTPIKTSVRSALSLFRTTLHDYGCNYSPATMPTLPESSLDSSGRKCHNCNS